MENCNGYNKLASGNNFVQFSPWVIILVINKSHSRFVVASITRALMASLAMFSTVFKS